MLYDLIKMAYIGTACLAGVMLVYITVDKKLRSDVIAMGLAALAVMSIIFLSPNIYILFALMLLVCPIFCRKKEHIAGILIMSILITPDLYTDLFIGGTRLIRFGASDALGFGAAITLIANGKKSKGILVSDILILSMAVLLLFIDARETSATNIFRSLTQIYLDLIIPCWVVTRSLKTENDLKIFMLFLIGTGCILSSFLIMESITSWSLFRETIGRYGMSPHWEHIKWRYGFLRASGPFLESTSMAFGLVFTFMAAWQFRSIFANAAARYAVIGALFIGISTCQSRNAYLGLIVGILAAAAYRKFHTPSTRAALFASALLLVAVPTGIILTSSPDKLSTIDVDSTVSYRATLLKRGWEEAQKNPIIGTNINIVTDRLSDMVQGEHIIDFVNSYLYVFLLSGFIGFFIFCLLIFSAPIISSTSRKLSSSKFKIEAHSYIFSMSICTILMLIFTFFGGRLMLMILVIIGIASYVAKLTNAQPKMEGSRRNSGARVVLPALRHGG